MTDRNRVSDGVIMNVTRHVLDLRVGTKKYSNAFIHFHRKFEHPLHVADSSDIPWSEAPGFFTRLKRLFDYDYSILELSAAVDFAAMPHVRPICWPSARVAELSTVSGLRYLYNTHFRF